MCSDTNTFLGSLEHMVVLVCSKPSLGLILKDNFGRVIFDAMMNPKANRKENAIRDQRTKFLLFGAGASEVYPLATTSNELPLWFQEESRISQTLIAINSLSEVSFVLM
jgi:hypothetical protein